MLSGTRVAAPGNWELTLARVPVLGLGQREINHGWRRLREKARHSNSALQRQPRHQGAFDATNGDPGLGTRYPFGNSPEERVPSHQDRRRSRSAVQQLDLVVRSPSQRRFGAKSGETHSFHFRMKSNNSVFRVVSECQHVRLLARSPGCRGGPCTKRMERETLCTGQGLLACNTNANSFPAQ